MTRGRRWIIGVGAGAVGVLAAVVIVGVTLAVAVVPWVFRYLLVWMGLW